MCSMAVADLRNGISQNRLFQQITRAGVCKCQESTNGSHFDRKHPVISNVTCSLSHHCFSHSCLPLEAIIVTASKTRKELPVHIKTEACV